VPDLLFISLIIKLKMPGKTILLTIVLFNIMQLQAQDISVNVLDFESFETLLSKKNDTVYVLNFWATWCAPCVKELPDFEKLNKQYQDKNFKMILVSLDFRKMLESHLLPFIEKNRLQAEVLMLHAPDANAWIDRIDPSWSGAIPATLIYKNEFSFFREGSMSYTELNQIVKPLIH